LIVLEQRDWEEKPRDSWSEIWLLLLLLLPVIRCTERERERERVQCNRRRSSREFVEVVAARTRLGFGNQPGGRVCSSFVQWEVGVCLGGGSMLVLQQRRFCSSHFAVCTLVDLRRWEWRDLLVPSIVRRHFTGSS
jgi:hypothetical protein